ncbi:MAG TPA: hypothetical protein VHG72_17915 [Polyangia bacterium]|nr:hypothetical protein [Polyangia bacterium]
MLAAAGLMATFGCAGVKQHAGGTGGGSGAATGSGGGSGNATGSGGGTVIVPTGCNGQCTDFEPTQDNPNPIFDINVPTDVGGMFGSPSGSGLCMTEPEDGSLFPNNWLPPRIYVPSAPSTGYLKITFHADMESTDLVAYTQGNSWALPKTVWQNLAGHIVEQPITVTVQQPNGASMSVSFQIAPVSAGGSMVFWSADPSQVGKQGVETMVQSAVVNDSYLLGFAVGDTSTTKALTIDQVQQEVLTNDQHTVRTSRCIGCHTGTPDGNYVSYVDAWPWPSVFANVEADATLHGQAMPGYLGCDILPTPLTNSTAACSSTMPPTEIQYAWNGPMTFSPAHWTDPASGTGERIAITSSQMTDFTQPWTTYDYEPGQLMWLDLNSNASTQANGLPVPTQGSAYGYLARTGDPNPAAGFPNWSQDGNTIVYVSTQCQNPNAQGNCGTQDGRLAKGPADIYQIPYNNKAGGNATPVPGASDSSVDEYYPSLSPDGDYLAFNSIPTGNGQMYANPLSELYFVPFNNQAGTKAVRMAANDPPACTGLKSPGVNNHWPKWSPTVNTASNGKTYYWIIFSSNRYNPTPMTVTNSGSSSVVYVSQLYITAIVKDEVSIGTYPAIYLYNQPSTRLNTTPAWQDFHIPIVIN